MVFLSGAAHGIGAATAHRLRYGPERIRFNVVAPERSAPGTGITSRSRSTGARLSPLGQVGEPTDLSAPIAFLASTDAAWIKGITMPVDGGVLAGPLQVFDQL